nr:hypothetical protein TetV2_00215 [Oceanusvirus sp.]
MEFLTDINDAYAVQINPVGANQMGGMGMNDGMIPPPAMQKNDPVVILPPMSSSQTTTPTYPESVVVDASRAQQAAANHGPYAPKPAPYIESTKLDSPTITEEPGYLERLGLRSRDVVRLIVLAFMIALGISIHWVGSHYITEWLESSDFNARQRLAVRLSYPVIIVAVMWNIKAFQQ